MTTRWKYEQYSLAFVTFDLPISDYKSSKLPVHYNVSNYNRSMIALNNTFTTCSYTDFHISGVVLSHSTYRSRNGISKFSLTFVCRFIGNKTNCVVLHPHWRWVGILFVDDLNSGLSFYSITRGRFHASTYIIRDNYSRLKEFASILY